MSSVLYIDASSGISGDMTVAALLDLGADREKLKRVFETLGVPGFRIEISSIDKGDVTCCDFDVILDKGYENHDHDMGYLYGHEKSGDYEVLTDLKENTPSEKQTAVTEASDGLNENNHGHDHVHTHKHGHTHAAEERTLKDVTDLIDTCDISENAKNIAKRTFEIVAEAEAKVHGKSIADVHFHEVGALDSIADIVAAAFCIDDLGIEEVIITHLTDGQGTVRCRHGIIPVPVPAVNEIVIRNEIPVEICDVRGEMVTPTGAAFAAAVRTQGDLPQSYRIIKSGYGNGKRKYPTRGYLAAHIIETDRK